MTAPTAPSPTECEHCDTEPHGIPLPPLPARHTLLTADGPRNLCTACVVALALASDVHGCHLTLSVTPAPALAA